MTAARRLKLELARVCAEQRLHPHGRAPTVRLTRSPFRAHPTRVRTEVCTIDSGREELSNGDLDCRGYRARALHRAVGPVLLHEHPSLESARTHLVHVVEAAGSLRHWPGRWWNPTDSTGRRRCAGRSLLILGQALAGWRDSAAFMAGQCCSRSDSPSLTRPGTSGSRRPDLVSSREGSRRQVASSGRRKPWRGPPTTPERSHVDLAHGPQNGPQQKLPARQFSQHGFLQGLCSQDALRLRRAER